MPFIRLYFPYFPLPPKEAAHQTMLNQALAIQAQGHTVEVVTWKTGAHKIQEALQKNTLPKDMIITHFGKTVTSAQVQDWPKISVDQRSIERSQTHRVIKSLFCELSPPELHYYHPKDDLRSCLAMADLEVYAYSFSYAWLRKFKRGKRVCIHFHNLESDLFRLRSQKAINPLVRRLHLLTATKLYRNELKVTHNCDEVWHHSKQDLVEHRRRGCSVEGRVISPTIDKKLHDQRVNAFKAQTRKNIKLGFIGGLDFEPNYQSCLWLLENIAPGLRERQFKGRLSVVGKHSDRIKDKAKQFLFVDLEGFLPSIEDWWSELSVLLAPDITSAGVRMKILEAIGSNVPVLTNSNAAERLPEKVQTSPLLKVSDDPSEWVNLLISPTLGGWREEFKDEPLNEDLDSSKMYSFIPSWVAKR